MWEAGRIYEVGPAGRDQRFAAVRENDEELQAVGHASLSQNLQRLSFEGVMRAGDDHSLREVLMMGSVSWFPSIISTEAGL